MRILEDAIGLTGALCEIGKIAIEEWRWTLPVAVFLTLCGWFGINYGWLRLPYAVGFICGIAGTGIHIFRYWKERKPALLAYAVFFFSMAFLLSTILLGIWK